MSARRTRFLKNRTIHEQQQQLDALLLQANQDRLGGKPLIADLDAELPGVIAREAKRNGKPAPK